MRLFIACDMPEVLRKKAVTLQKFIGDEHARIKWVEPENIHLTLKFLGEVEDSQVEALKDALGGIRSEAFDCSASGFGVFPSDSYIRVLWMGLEPAGKISELHEKIDDVMSPLGFKPDRSFRAHVTLGRVRSVTDKQGLIGRVREMGDKDKEAGPGGNGKCRIDSFMLKKSTLTPKGPVYEDVAVFGLG